MLAYSCDLATDHVYGYSLNLVTGELSDYTALELPAGDGPRSARNAPQTLAASSTALSVATAAAAAAARRLAREMFLFFFKHLDTLTSQIPRW